MIVRNLKEYNGMYRLPVLEYAETLFPKTHLINTYLITCQHILPSTHMMLRSMINIGLDPNNISCNRKITLNRPHYNAKYHTSLRVYELASMCICIPMFIGGFTIKLCHATQNQVIYFCIRLIAITTLTICITSLFNFNIFFYLILGGVSSIIPSCLSQILEEYGKYTGTAASLYGSSTITL